jgi:hypothetical protein
MGQPDLFSKDLSDSSRNFINGLEKLSHAPLIKYLGSRLVIRARLSGPGNFEHQRRETR